MNQKTKLVTGLMPSRADAERVINSLSTLGFTQNEISVVMSDATRTKHFALETGTKAAQGAGFGGAIGGTLGAIIAGIAAIGTNVILPGLGLVIFGPIAAGLAGAGAGGALGTLVGGMIGAGIPEHEAKAYEEGLKAGGILLGVEARTDDEAELLERIFKTRGAEGTHVERMRKASGNT